MRFPYARIPIDGPKPGTMTIVFRPMISVRIIGPTGERDVFGRVDTGADDILVPEDLVRVLGVAQLSDPVLIRGIGGGVTARFGDVDLEIADDHSSYQWRPKVGFVSPASLVPVFGLRGFINRFWTLFDGRNRHLELIPWESVPALTAHFFRR